jgi:hypothetical protein
MLAAKHRTQRESFKRRAERKRANARARGETSVKPALVPMKPALVPVKPGLVPTVTRSLPVRCRLLKVNGNSLQGYQS